MCVFLTLIFFGPRVALVLWWLFQPGRFDLMFSTFIWPLIGLIFVPWTTLMYVIVGAGGLAGWDWFWIILALLVDIASWGGGYSKKDKVMKSGGSSTPPTSPPPPPSTPPADTAAGSGTQSQ